MIILGIDPGSRATGYGVLDVTNSQLRSPEYGVIKASPKKPLGERLQVMFEGISHILSDWKPDVVSIETPFLGNNVKTALVLGHVRGVLLLASTNSGAKICEFAPTSIKKAVVGNGHADKSQVEYMLRAMLSLPADPIKDDAFDALGAAFCAYSHKGAL